MSAAVDGVAKLPVQPEELEFFAEEERITIIPNFDHEDDGGYICCYSERYGPFSPNIPVEVPIWMATHLFKRGKCRIMPPPWLSVRRLKSAIEEEQRDATGFQPLPYYGMEVAWLLFRRDTRACFGEEFSQVRTLLQQLANIRRHKIEEGLAQVNGALTVKLNNLCACEVNTIRLNFLGTLNMYLKLEETENAITPQAGTQGGSAY